jgi:hypothetical protein
MRFGTEARNISPAGSFETSLICAGTELLNDTHSLTHPTTPWLYWNERRWKKPFFILKKDKMTSAVRNDGSREPKRTSITILVLGDGEYLILSFVLTGKKRTVDTKLVRTVSRRDRIFAVRLKEVGLSMQAFPMIDNSG